MMKAFLRWIYIRLYKSKREIQTLKFIQYQKKRQVNISENGNILEKCTFDGKNVVGECNVLSNVSLGMGSYIGRNCWIKRTKTGKYCSIANNVSTALGSHPLSKFVSTHPAFFSLSQEKKFGYVHTQKFDEYKWLDENNKIQINIGNDVWIANNSVILEGVSIGDGSVVCAGAVVTKDVPPYAIVGGVPAKVIRYRFDEKQIQYLLQLKWWDKPEEWIKNYAQYFDDIDILKERFPL